jgi:ubiquitin-like-conjugating enzyme ATG3
MKRIMEHASSGGKEVKVDWYMVIFLKFLSAILPTMEYDYTISMEG